ncbi:MAG: toll/interleukin-1 receptor domain-containing protein [Chloroflexota bacterium]|nr:toll/interleukin-1 receptor domain-containing protein [Chloroflexota bacterium]MDQ5867316.1 toll/interleukin-1 receptor domain-containing protein [Chloroflexota bacterium]
MANPEQLEILMRGPAAWNEWRNQHPEEWIDLTEAVLAHVGYSGHLTTANLEEIDFRNAKLTGANLTAVNLFRADLRGADLSEAKLFGAFLKEADLAQADLRGTNLVAADLTEANLTAALLLGADLSGANLSGANLTYATLLNADFTQATCYHAIFTQVLLSHAIFVDVDLGAAQGLQTVNHVGPSVMDINTLYQSRGKIPEAFLRGIGVPENLIEYLPSLSGQPLQFYSCFISYSHNDKAFARRLHDGLQGRGIRCWLDEKQLLPGHNIYDEVDRGIRLWDKVLLCCSQHSLTSWWVDNEINTAFAKEQHLQKERGRKALALIPLDLDGYLFTGWNDGKAQQVKARLAADFKGWEHDNAKFEEQFERVVKALQTDDGREAPPTPRL